MSKLVRALGALPLVGIAAFCAFGFLAAPAAPVEAAGLIWLLLGVIGFVSLCGVGWLLWPRRLAWRPAILAAILFAGCGLLFHRVRDLE
jgi:hypothetical protein